jgi:hypothetical protein
MLVLFFESLLRVAKLNMHSSVSRVIEAGISDLHGFRKLADIIFLYFPSCPLERAEMLG